jgi:hypothetical protein
MLLLSAATAALGEPSSSEREGPPLIGTMVVTASRLPADASAWNLLLADAGSTAASAERAQRRENASPM